MGDMTEGFRALDEYHKQRRADNREKAPEILRENGIEFTVHNGGAHFIVVGKDCLIDFWAGTERWKSRNQKKGFGIENLVNFVKGKENG